MGGGLDSVTGNGTRSGGFCLKAQKPTGTATVYGLSPVWPTLSGKPVASHTTPAMSGECFAIWDGAASGLPAKPSNAMRKPSGVGNGINGRPLKKSHPRRPNHRFRRREWNYRTSSCLPDLGTPRTDPATGVSLQLEASVCHCWHYLVAVLLPVVSRNDPRTASPELPDSSAAPHPGAVACHLGWPAGASESQDPGFPGPTPRADPLGRSSGLCSGAQSHRVHLGPLEEPRHGQPLREGLCAPLHDRTPILETGTKTPLLGACLLETS